jgi:hypothetical protein
LSSTPAPYLSTSLTATLTLLFVMGLAGPAAPLAAQDDTAVTPDATQAAPAEPAPQPQVEEEDEEPRRINLSITVPREEASQAQLQECRDRADAGEISGEILVCRQLEDRGKSYATGTRSETQKRYAQETAFKNAPRTPDVSGLPNNGRGIGIGGVPPPALIIDVEALPDAPAGSDADRIARGLPPLGQDEDLSEEEIRKRREKLGLPPPAFEKKKKGN